MGRSQWIPVRKSHLKYYTDIELYYRAPSGNIVLYKPPGMPFSDESLSQKPYLGDLFVKKEDKMACLQAAQNGFNKQLVSDIRSKDITEIKESLLTIVGDTLAEPRSGGLKAITGTVQAVVEGFSTRKDVIKNLVRISFKDYTTAMHSINVMALMVGYCYYTGKDEDVTRKYALAALLHDVGKIDIPSDILTAQRPLEDHEFETIKTHTTIGAEILEGYAEPEIREAMVGCLEHHEKLDGGGYPNGRGNISECGRILSIIDCYEAVTNDDRPYRSAMNPIHALELLKKDVDSAKFDAAIFKDFAYSLADH